jgi:hypothetical protein
MAIEAELADGRILEFPDGTDPSVVQATVRRVLAQAAPPTTAFGQAKEFFKGIPSGAVGLLESAATGASALLPEDMEKSAREKIKSVATAAKSPFTAAPGYEEAIGRKFGESVGSTAPFLLAGPLGRMAQAGAAALGVGAGAGEARVRAEEGKAEEGGRGTATALGAVVGATEMLPVFSFIKTLGKPLTDGISSQIRRAFATGGAEAAQEAAAQAAQNLIAKGIYKPEQAIIEGTGEAAAYGGATGALIQGLTDMALGRRAKGAAPAAQPPVQEPPAQEPIPAPPVPLAERPYPELAKEVARISALADTREATPAEMQDLKAMRAELQRRGVEEIKAKQAAAKADVEGAKEFPGLAGNAPAQMEMREAMPEGPLPPETDLFGKPLLPKATQPEGLADVIGAELPATSEVMRDAGLAPTTEELEAAGQQRLPLRRTPEGKPTTAPTAAPAPPAPAKPAAAAPVPPPPAPAKPGAITATKVKQFGTMSKANRQWLVDNVEGKTPDEVRAMVEADPTIVPKGVAKTLQEIITQATPKEAPSVPPPAPVPAVPPVQPRSQPRGSEPSVGVPVQPAGADTVQPGATGTPGGVAPPVSSGLVPPKQPPAPGVGPTGQPAPALTTPPKPDYAAMSREDLQAARDNASGTNLAMDVNAIRRYFGDAAADAYQKMTSRQRNKWWDANATTELEEASSVFKGVNEETIDEYINAYNNFDINSPQALGRSIALLARNINDATFKGSPAYVTLRNALAYAKQQGWSEAEVLNAMRGRAKEWAGSNAEELFKDLFKKAPAAQAAPAKPALPSAAPANMFGQLVKRGTPDLVEDEAPAPATPAKPASPFDVSGPSSIASAIADTEEEAAAKKAAGKKTTAPKAPAPSAITKTPPVQEPAKPTEAKPAEAKPAEAKPAKPKGPRTELETLDAINGKNLLEVAQWGAANFTDPDFRLIAQRVADTLQILKNVGLKIGDITVTDPGMRMASGARGATYYSYNKSGAAASTVSVTLNHPDNKDNSGLEDRTILHELIHAATMGATRVGNLQRAKGTRVAKNVSELYDVAKAVFKQVDAKAARGETLSKTEERLRTNYMRDADEILAWTLTDRDMQAYMETVPYKGTNAWDKFVTLVRDMLGLTPKADTALSEILRIGGELTSLTEADLKDATKVTGKQFSLSATTESLIAGSGAVDPVEESALKRMINIAKADPGISYGTKFRTQVADIGATIESRLTAQFDGAVKDALGNVNPMGLYRQAQDYTKMLLEFFQQGSLVKNPATKLWEVTTAKGVRPPAEVYALIDKWGKANGWTREEATQKASRILEAVRLDGLRTANNTQGASFTLHKIDESSSLSIDQQINALLADYRADPALKEMNKLMDESRNALVDHLVSVGRLTPDQGQDWKDVIGYVPFDRLSPESLEKFSKIKRVSGKGLAQVGKLPELKGTTRLAVGNVFNSYIDTMGWMVGQVIKTDGTVQTLRSLEKVTAAKFLGLSTQNEPNVVGMYVDGVMNYWSLPSKYDVMAFKDLNPPKANWLLQLGAFSNVLRKTITVLPPFALKQVTDDVQRAIMTSGVRNPGALLRMTLTNFPKLALSELRGIQHPTVREFGALGLTGEYDFQSGKPAVSLLKDMGIVKRGKFETLLHRLDGVTRASDLAVRKAIYDQTLKEGGDKLLAQTRAREFINFRRRGASERVGVLVTTIPFFNAYIQGMDVFYRAASGKDSSSSVGRAQARQMFWGRAAIVTMLSSLYALGKDDEDEDYKNMDLRTRDSNWILPGGYKLPVPGELGAIFKVIPERVVEYMRRQGTPEEQEAFEAVRTTLTYMFEQYVGRAAPVPQAIKPVLEAWANKSFLTGRPLEGFHQRMMDPSMRVTDQTSELARAISNFTRDEIKAEVSPIMIDNALRGYFGSTAALLTAMTDSLLNPTRVDRPLHKWALLSTYLYDPVGTRLMTEFYEEREKMGKANATLNQLMKTDTDRAVQYAETHQDELVFESAINSTLEQLQRTRAYRTFLNSPDGAKEMPTEEREAALKEIKQYETEMVKWLREAKTEYAKSKP